MTQKGTARGSTWSVFRQTRGLYRGFGVVRTVSPKVLPLILNSSYCLGGIFVLSSPCIVFYGL